VTPDQPQGKPRSKRMIFLLVVAPVALLLLSLAGANWKVFHLAYCRHLMKNEDPVRQFEGLDALVGTHLRRGMTREEIARLLTPFKMEFYSEGVALVVTPSGREANVLLAFEKGVYKGGRGALSPWPQQQ